MIYLILILLVLFICFLITYYYRKKDITAPSMMVILGLFASVFCALLNYGNWVVEYNYSIFLIICLGVISFLVCSAFYRRKAEPIQYKPEEISLRRYKRLVIFIFYIVTLIKTVSEVRRLAILGGWNGDFNTFIGTYRAYSMSRVSFDTNISIIVSQMIKICNAISFVVLYIIANNVEYKKQNRAYNFLKNNWFYFVIVLINMIFYILLSARMGIIRMILSFVFFDLVLMKGFGHSFTYGEAIKKYLFLFILLFVFFSRIRFFIGRSTKMGIFQYLTFYAGGAVGCLQIYLNGAMERARYFGQETFSGLYTIFSKLGVVNNISRAQPFVPLNAKTINNIYTAFRRYYTDFGYFGVVIMPALMAVITNSFYNVITLKKIENPVKLACYRVLYGAFGYGLLMLGIDDQFFTIIFSTTGIMTILYIVIVVMLLFRVEIRF